MTAPRTPVLYVIDRAPRFRRQLVEALRQEGGEAYGVESVDQALRLLELFPRRFRVLVDLGPGAPQALTVLGEHPSVSEVAVLSSRPGPVRRTRYHGFRRASADHSVGSDSDDGPSGAGTVVQRARAKQAAITAYPSAQGQAGRSQSTVSLDVQR